MAKEIPLNLFEDYRGKLFHNNSFDMTDIKRQYIIETSDTMSLRGWQGHQIERKWFFCIRGQFKVHVVAVQDFKNPDMETNPDSFVLDAAQPRLLSVNQGSATALRALQDNSSLLVFSDMTVENSKQDDYRFNIDTWKIN